MTDIDIIKCELSRRYRQLVCVSQEVFEREVLIARLAGKLLEYDQSLSAARIVVYQSDIDTDYYDALSLAYHMNDSHFPSAVTMYGAIINKQVICDPHGTWVHGEMTGARCYRKKMKVLLCKSIQVGEGHE